MNNQQRKPYSHMQNQFVQDSNYELYTSNRKDRSNRERYPSKGGNEQREQFPEERKGGRAQETIIIDVYKDQRSSIGMFWNKIYQNSMKIMVNQNDTTTKS